MNEKQNIDLPTGLFRRKDSPFIWGKLKVDGMKKPFSFSTQTADVKLAKIQYDVKRGEALQGKIQQRPDGIGLKAMVERAIALMRKDSQYRRSAMNVVDWLMGNKPDVPANSITPENIEEYDLWRSKRAAISTCNREIGYLQSCYNIAIRKMKLRLENPVNGFERHDESGLARDRILTYEERARLFTDPLLPQEMKDVYMFAMKTGLRQGELIELRWADVSFGAKTIKVKTEKKKKRGTQMSIHTFRHVPLSIYPWQIVRKRRELGWDKRSEYVFCTEDGKQLSRDGQITTALEWACKRNKIENFHYHDFRHTFCTDFLRAARDLKAYKSLSEIMGHSMESMTVKYSHLFPEDKMTQINLLPLEPGYEAPATTIQSSYVEATEAK